MPTTTIPVTVAPEAEAFLDERGVRPVFERLIEHACRTIPDLQAVEATFHPDVDGSCDDFIALHARSGIPEHDRGAVADAWMDWLYGAVAADVARHFILFVVGGEADAR
jgi:hypothetical protein